MNLKHQLPSSRRLLMIAAFASIIAGAIFIINYPKSAQRHELDMQRITEAQNLEQALEWYMIRKASERGYAPAEIPSA